MDFGGGLKPIVVEGFEIGDTVRQARSGSIFWVIGEGPTGYIIGNKKGETHDCQRANTLSPFTRITKTNDLPKMKADGIARIKQAILDKRAADDAARKAKDEADDRAFNEAKARFEAEFPDRVPDDAKMSRQARAAKNMRMQLKGAFPGVKFSIKSRSFAGGDSVDVSWVLGPTTGEVDAIIGRYEPGSFNGMEDIYEYDRDAVRSAFRAVMGATKYAHSQREIPQELRERVEADLRACVTGVAEHEWYRHVSTALDVSFVGGEYDGLDNSQMIGWPVAKVRKI